MHRIARRALRGWTVTRNPVAWWCAAAWTLSITICVASTITVWMTP